MTMVVLSQAGTQGWLGVSLEEASYNGVKQAVVYAVSPGSAAARARLQPGDAIITVDGTPVASPGRVHEVIGKRVAGSAVRLGIVRYGADYTRTDAKGRLLEVTVVLDPRPPPAPSVPSMPVAAAESEPRALYAYVAPHANASETNERWRNADMSSVKQTVARLLQEALMRQGVHVVTDPRLADVLLIPTTESHRNYHGELLMDAKYTVRAETHGTLVASFSLDYPMDFDRMTSDDLAEQHSEHARKMAYAIVSSPAVMSLAVGDLPR
jgi:hypothetical protein